MLEKAPLDALIVGAGFSGIYLLNTLRSNGFRVKVFETGSDLGGTWYWNHYPGARTDSDYSFYQLSDPLLVESFNFTERFPARDEVLQYFKVVDEKYQLKKDIIFNNTVTKAQFNEELNMWEVTSTNSGTTLCRHLLLCLGMAAKSYLPDIKGIDKFKGEVLHSAHWPNNKNIEFKGKRIAVIGTGASGVQVIQEVGPIADHLTVYQRTPNLALPMRQHKLPNPNQLSQEEMTEIFSQCRKGFAGMTFMISEKNALETTEAEREAFYETLWANGGFSFWLANYQDLFESKEANDTAYAFWAKKVRARINDNKKKDILAPLTPPHPFGTKRPSLEQSYYEVFNLDSVDIIDINRSRIIEITETGIKTESEGNTEVDMIIFATGFDAVSGSMSQIDIVNAQGESVNDKWQNGILSNLGISVPGFPNMFYTYGPQAPTAFSNGPTCCEVQGEWLTKLLISLRAKDVKRIQAKEESAIEWKKKVKDIWESSLFPHAKSWYQGSNIPGKKIEPLNYAGGIPQYILELKASEENDYNDFIVQ